VFFKTPANRFITKKSPKMNPLLPLSLVFLSLAVAPTLQAPAPTPEDGIDLATGDSNLHYAYGHAYGHESSPYGHGGYHHSYGHQGYADYGYGHQGGHHAGHYGGGHHGDHGYGYGHPAPHHIPHHSVAPLHHAVAPLHHAAGPGFAGPLLGAGPHGPGPHHGAAYGVDLVGPYSQHDGPFGPFGFYANFYNHH